MLSAVVSEQKENSNPHEIQAKEFLKVIYKKNTFEIN